MLKRANKIGKESFKELKRPLKTSRGKFLTAKTFFTQSKNPQFSVTVSKKVAKTAVLRNKIRRVAYEVLRKNLGNIQKGLAIQFVLNKNPDTLKELEKDLYDLLLQNNNIHPAL